MQASRRERCGEKRKGKNDPLIGGSHEFGNPILPMLVKQKCVWIAIHSLSNCYNQNIAIQNTIALGDALTLKPF